MFWVIAGVVGAVAAVLLSGVRILKEYERGVVFRLGRARPKMLGPGISLLLPLGVDKAVVVDTRIRVVQIPPQEVITRDNISIVVDAVVYTTVESPTHAILDVEQYMPATLQLAATTLRAVIGRMDLDDILAHRDEINDEVRGILDLRTEQWGVEISAVELKDIELPQEMKRAMARQAEAERERRAKVIAAAGEVQAGKLLAEAARSISATPEALQLRLYQTLVEISGEKSSKIVVPIPIELMAGISRSGSNGMSREQIAQLVHGAVQAIVNPQATPPTLEAKDPAAELPSAPKPVDSTESVEKSTG